MNKPIKILNIFSKYIKNNYKKIPLRVKTSDVASTRYFPPVSKEWINSIYVFNQNSIKNFPMYNLKINYLIKSFFNLRFNHKFLFKKYKSFKQRYSSFNRIYASKAEIKHTNNKAILTVYLYNREKIALLNKIQELENSFYKKVDLFNKNKFKSIPINLKKKAIDFESKDYNIINKPIKAFLIRKVRLLRRYKLLLSLNKYKFEEKLLYKLKNFIIKFYNKKVEFNIVNIKSVVFHSDFFTNILISRLKNRKNNILYAMDAILNRVVLPKVNKIVERSLLKKNYDVLENKYKNLNVSFLLKNKNLSQFLYNLYNNIIKYKKINNIKYKYWHKIYGTIFNSINYKNMGGVRLEVKGRLTKRYRADRSVFKLRWKGGLKNIDSSYKGLSTVNFRGYAKANVDYSIFTSKRRIGAFAVKGWLSGK